MQTETQTEAGLASNLTQELGLPRITIQQDAEQTCWYAKLECEKTYSNHIKIIAQAKSKEDVISELKSKIILLASALQDFGGLAFSNTVNQYYWHENTCREMDIHSTKCICWHDEGTGVHSNALFDNEDTWPNVRAFTWRTTVKA